MAMLDVEIRPNTKTLDTNSDLQDSIAAHYILTNHLQHQIPLQESFSQVLSHLHVWNRHTIAQLRKI